MPNGSFIYRFLHLKHYQINEQIYNYVKQEQAAQLTKNMYSNNKFTSDLVNSYAWDTTIIFLQKCGTNSKYSIQKSLNKFLARTGTNNIENKDIQCNIYDMSGNVYEWTTETSSNPNGPCTRRGGCCYDKDTYYTSHRFGFTTSHVNDSFGFRPILYINV